MLQHLRRLRGTVRFRTGLHLFLLALSLAALQPAPLLIVPGPRQMVQTSHPLVAVHTRLTDEVEPWKIKRSLELVREMGAGWIVEYFPWAYYHGPQGEFGWQHPDLVVDHAHAQGLKIVARLGLTPYWARPPDTPDEYLGADAYDDFAMYAAAFVARYRGKVSHIIVWNEPNLAYEWGYRPTGPADYVELLKVVYPAVKAANPDIVVLAGALAPTLEPAGSAQGLNDLQYLEAMYREGAADYFDALAAHPYGNTFPPAAEPGPDILNFRRVELMREIMVRYNDAATPIFITETGWNDHPRWTRAVRPAQRIQYTIDAFLFAEENWPYVEMVAIWMFRTPAPLEKYNNNFTMVTPEFVKKPIYDAIQVFTGNAPE